MSSQYVTLIDQARQVVATAEVAEQDGQFTGWIDLRSLPGALQQLFAEYEEIVQYLRHLSGVDSVVDPPKFSHLGDYLINRHYPQ